MLRFVVRRLIGMVGVLFAISVLVFLIFNVIPNSDPAARIAGKNADPELIARVSADLGLDQPLYVQYLTMMKQIFTGQLTSYASSQNVVEQIWKGLPATLSLCIGAAVLWMALAICRISLALYGWSAMQSTLMKSNPQPAYNDSIES